MEAKINSDISIAILIPCYNEEKTIGKVIEDFRSELPQAKIYVFDNNSTDQTAAIAREKGALVFREKRQGKGFVVSSMFTKVDADIYVMVDGDDTYPAQAVHGLIDPIRLDRADMTVGTRLETFSSKAFRPLHIFGNNLVIALVNGLFKSHLSDIMSGYRAFSRDLVKNLPLISKGFEVETQMVIQSLYYGYKIEEVGIEYRERPEGSFSKLNTYRDGFKVIVTIFNIAKAYRPLLFFGSIGLVLTVLGLGLGFVPVIEFFRTGYVTHFPTAILATGLIIVAILFLAMGLILDTLNFRLKEIHYRLNKR